MPSHRKWARSPAVDRLEAALDRANRSLNRNAAIFTELYCDSGRREAMAADERAARAIRLGPLDGCIVSIKASFDVAGHRTSAGSAILRNRSLAQADAAVVRRLRKAGAIIIGKTQMTEFAFSALGTNPHDGTPANPHDRLRVPGGSSSGAVVSVVEAIADIGIGSDTGGSLRIPAALSGATGFKPTGGRIPTEGVVPLSRTLDTIGPIAATVSDIVAADEVLSGRLDRSPPQTATPDSLQVIIGRGRLFDGVEQAVLAAFEESMTALRDAGVRVIEGSLDESLAQVDRIDALGNFPSIELGAYLRELGFDGLDGIEANTRTRIEAGAGVSAIDYVRMGRLRELAIASFEKRLGDCDVVAVPTTPIRAPLLSEVGGGQDFQRINGLMLRNPRFANLLDCPSISLPMAISGLPAGLMLIGRRHADRFLLKVAGRIEAILAASTHGKWAGTGR